MLRHGMLLSREVCEQNTRCIKVKKRRKRRRRHHHHH